MSLKYANFFTLSEENLKSYSQDIKEKFQHAQLSAMDAVSHGGLKPNEYVDAYQWLITTELLGVVNEATSKKSLGPDDQYRVQMKTIKAEMNVNDYLQKINEIGEITNFIASKIKIDVFVQL